MTLNYNKKVMKLFMNPKNMGEIKDADGIGKVGNPKCGDIMWVYIKVKDNKISDIKFKTFVCAAAIATSSMITQVAKGKTLKDAGKIKYKEVVDSLGGLPTVKIHCSQLATEALNKAIEDYQKKKVNRNGK
jgi:nitrogen fixation NifU-like protein